MQWINQMNNLEVLWSEGKIARYDYVEQVIELLTIQNVSSVLVMMPEACKEHFTRTLAELYLMSKSNDEELLSIKGGC